MGEILRCAIKSLSRKRARTWLTVCSIAVGVTMVVIVSFISSAGKSVVNEELENMGISGLSVSCGTGQAGLSEDNLYSIRNLAGVETAMPLMIEYSTSQLRDTSNSTLICGLDSGARQVISLELKHGRLISRGDVQAGAMVCVVDETVALEAYSRENITGKTIDLQIGGMTETFTIIGVTEAGSSLLQNVVDLIPGMVYVPYTTLQNLTGRDSFDQIAVRVGEGADVERVESNILHTLEGSSGTDGYRTDNLAAQRDQLTGLMDIVTVVLTVISGISLVVSGLGIMTIMLVSVKERTREIGTKKAIGATKKRILMEFLTEAVVISLGGSVCGILLGSAVSAAGLFFLGAPIPFDWQGMLLLIAFSVFTGAVFGVYPAMKAAKLKPVDALRME